MSTQTTPQTSSTPKTQSAIPLEVVPLPAWKEILPLSQVLFGIGRDSRRDPQNYLDEVVVPHGGE